MVAVVVILAMICKRKSVCFSLQTHLCVCIRQCVGSRGYEIGDNSYEAQCGWVHMGSPRQRPEFTDNNDYAA